MAGRPALLGELSGGSYRYAWAERAMRLGYSERGAQAALGHNSRAVHQAYAKKAQVESLGAAENILVIGYSLPETDAFFSLSLRARNRQRNSYTERSDR